MLVVVFCGSGAASAAEHCSMSQLRLSAAVVLVVVFLQKWDCQYCEALQHVAAKAVSIALATERLFWSQHAALLSCW